MPDLDLFACPFCESTNLVVEGKRGRRHQTADGDAAWWVTCVCEAEGPLATTELGAIAMWNHRPLEARIEDLERMILQS